MKITIPPRNRKRKKTLLCLPLAGLDRPVFVVVLVARLRVKLGQVPPALTLVYGLHGRHEGLPHIMGLVVTLRGGRERGGGLLDSFSFTIYCL